MDNYWIVYRFKDHWLEVWAGRRRFWSRSPAHYHRYTRHTTAVNAQRRLAHEARIRNTPEPKIASAAEFDEILEFCQAP